MNHFDVVNAGILTRKDVGYVLFNSFVTNLWRHQVTELLYCTIYFHVFPDFSVTEMYVCTVID